jgi:integrase
MKTVSFSVRFTLRMNRAKEEKAPLYLIITVNNKRSEIALKQFVSLSDWNDAKGMAKTKNPALKNLNIYLEQVRSEVVQHFQEMQAQRKLITAEALKNKFLGTVEEEKREFSLCGLMSYHNDNMKLTLEKGTMKNYYTTEKYVKEFLLKKHRTSDIYLSELNYQFVIEFEIFLRSHAPLQNRKKLANNGVMKHLERLRKMVTLAVKLEWTGKDPFANYQLKFQRIERGFLSKEELSAIEEVKITHETLEYVKDMFIFSCYTGLAYADLMQLKPEQLLIGIDGGYWIKTTRQKTDTLVNVPLLPKAKLIAEKYKDHPRAIPEGRLFPYISNQTMNGHLKMLAQICNIHKNLSFHIARHTFATTVTLSNGVPIETVSKMLGHTKITTTQIYAKVVERKISADMLLLNEKLNAGS